MKIIYWTIILLTIGIYGCVVPDEGAEEPIAMKNNSDETLLVSVAYYTPREFELATVIYEECLPKENYIFKGRRHIDRPIVVKIYSMEEVRKALIWDENNKTTIGDLPIQPLASYVFTDSQLEAHDWTFTYPPSEEWMQSGIKEIESNN